MEKKQPTLSDIGLIRKIAWGFCKSTRLDFNDLFQEACFAYFKSLEAYNPKKGALSTYMWWCISSHLKNYLKTEQKHSNCTPFEEFSEDIREEYIYAPSKLDYFEKLSEDALMIAKMVLRTPTIYATRTPEDVVSRLKNIMEQQGWPRSKTLAAINVLHEVYS